MTGTHQRGQYSWEKSGQGQKIPISLPEQPKENKNLRGKHMEAKRISYEFTAKPYLYSSSVDMIGWTFVSLPKELSLEIRNNFKWQEEGWGRMKVTAKIGSTEWQTAIWFDTKQDTYFPSKQQYEKKKRLYWIKT